MFRSAIYDFTFARLTARWYRDVLLRVPAGSRMLDVGVGTASALAMNAPLLLERRIHVTGIDIDADYVRKARQRVAKEGLEDRIDIRLESIYDHQNIAGQSNAGRSSTSQANAGSADYDAVYFSASFMLLERPEDALRHVHTLLKPGGHILFTQTFSERRSRLMEVAKPLLGKFTTMEFGRVTYEDEFLRTLQQSGFVLEELVVMKRSAGQSFRLAIAAPGEKGFAV